MKRALVCGAGGFIGGHLVKRLQRDGYWVRGADIKANEWHPYPFADEFKILDLRHLQHCLAALSVHGGFDEVYQLAADMGGMGFIHSHETAILRNNALINLNMIEAAITRRAGRYFFSSSVCVYRDMRPGEPEMREDEAIPAHPDNEYGWEKLYAERVALAYQREHKIPVRIARFQNCYGPRGTWAGGREKAPAAICRKVAEAQDGGEIAVWGDGSAVRSYTYVDDLVDGIVRLMRSDLEGPVNIGCPQYVTVDELAWTVIEASGKRLAIRHVPGPVGVASRNFSNVRIESIGWRAKTFLKDGIGFTYPWIKEQVEHARDRADERQVPEHVATVRVSVQ